MWNSGTALHGPLESPVVAPVTALVRLLDDLGDVIDRVPDQVFARKPQGQPSGSIGAHVRHCLDHVAAFLDGARTGRMSYDNRVRGTEGETDRDAALTRIRGLTAAVLDLDPRLIPRSLCLRVRLDPRGATTDVQSTVGRELAFVISHTIHHNATIAILLSEIGTDLPNRFGVAPSTPSPASADPRAAPAPTRTSTPPPERSGLTMSGTASCAP